MLLLPVNALFLLIFTTGIKYKGYSSFGNNPFLVFILVLLLFAYFMGSFFVFFCIKESVINPLSRIQLTIFKEKDCYIFSCRKWLLRWRYQNFLSKIDQAKSRTTLDSIGCNLTPKEYKWIKAEINKFVDDESIM